MHDLMWIKKLSLSQDITTSLATAKKACS